MQPSSGEAGDFAIARTSAEVVVRVGLLLLLAFWCFSIAQPFLVPIVWGMVIAVAIHHGYDRLRHALGGRAGLAATLVSVVLLLLMILPLALLSRALVDDVSGIAGALTRGEVRVPPPPAWLAGWPVIGAPLDQFWQQASANLGQALDRIEPQLRAVGVWLVSFVAGAGFGMLGFMAAIVIAGVLLAHSVASTRLAQTVAARLMGARGADYVRLAERTIRGVARGVLGTALIQSLLVGIGFVAAGIPGAAFLTLISFLLSVVQLGPGLILLAAVIYKFSLGFTPGSVLFLAWCLLAGVSDNFLRPILLSRGGDVPVWVILIGTLGGLLAHGLIGLFVGPIVISLGYRLFQVWIEAPGSAVERDLGRRKVGVERPADRDQA
jgi:predicted PurR-regulated permease PerM